MSRDMVDTCRGVPERYRRCSPLSYVDRVRARCWCWPERTTPGARSGRSRTIWPRWLPEAQSTRCNRFDAGHGSLVVDERERQMRVELEFLAKVLDLDAPT